jgi:hypothetical protein
MDEFAHFDESFVLELIAVLLLMAIWACAIVAIDHWVSAARSNLLHRAPSGHEVAPQDEET